MHLILVILWSFKTSTSMGGKDLECSQYFILFKSNRRDFPELYKNIANIGKNVRDLTFSQSGWSEAEP